MRKLVVSGALNELVAAGILVVTDSTFRIGKTKEFQFVGVDGTDYEFAGRRPPWLS